MRILPISFNSNYKTNKVNKHQSRPMSSKADSIEFSKDVSFGANLTSEEEIYEIDKKATHLARFVLSEMSSKMEIAKDELKQAQDIWQNIQSMLINNDKNPIKEYKEDGTKIEITQDNASVIYKSYSEPNSPHQYNEWVFNLSGKLKSVSKGVIMIDDTKKIDYKYLFVNDKLDSIQRGIKEEKGRSLKIDSEIELMGERLLRYCKGITVSQNEITHIKEKLHFDTNNKLFSYIQDEVSGLNWSTSAHEIIYAGSLITQYQRGKFSNSNGKEYEQISYFKDSKLYKTRVSE